VLAQPIHTTSLPELTTQETKGDRESFAGSLRWALDSMAWLVVPVSVAMVALALPAMRLVVFGEAVHGGVGLLAAGLASLAAGLFFYSAFLLLARAYYALGDSRTPALVALASAVVGAAVMAGGSRMVHGTAVVAWLGLGHSAAYLVGAVALAVGLSRRTGRAIVPAALPRAFVLAAPLGALAWWVWRWWDPSTRLGNLVLLTVAGIVGGALYVLGVHAIGGPKLQLRRAGRPPGDFVDLDPDRAEMET
jgi:putative peptidoglycan lipid II flippase